MPMNENCMMEEIERLVKEGKGIKMIKMANAKRKIKVPSENRIETLHCMTKDEEIDLSYFHFLLRLSKNDPTLLDREGGIQSIRKKMRKINERIKKRFQRALVLERKRKEPVRLSKLLRIIQEFK